MVVNIEVADMMAGKNNNIEIQFGERVGHEGWLIGPKLFDPEAYLACASSKLCEFIRVYNYMGIAHWATSNRDPKVGDSSSKEYRLTSIFGRWDRLASLVSATFKGGFFASRALLNNNVTWSR